jgi:hypothetical protein
VLACWCDDKSAAGWTTVRTCWRNYELAVGRTMVLASLWDDGVDGRADDGALASSAVPCSLVRRWFGGGANDEALTRADFLLTLSFRGGLRGLKTGAQTVGPRCLSNSALGLAPTSTLDHLPFHPVEVVEGD